MSLDSDNLSIISLGQSCQTAHQLNHNVEALRAATGIDALTIASSYFDYILAPIRKLTGMLEDFRDLQSADELENRSGNAYWDGLWFIHNFRTGDMVGDLDIPGQFGRDQSKISYLKGKFLKQVSDPDKRYVFVISNTQSNLPIFSNGSFCEEFGFTRERVSALVAALDKHVGDRLICVVVVEDAKTDSGAWELPKIVRTNIGKQVPDWQGDYAEWSSALLKVVPGQLK